MGIVLSTLIAVIGADMPPEEEPRIPPEVLQAGGATPASPGMPPALKTDPAEAQALGKVLHDLLLKYLPDPVTKSNHNWGHQKAVTVTHHHLEGLRLWSESVQEMKNDGVWRRTDIRIPDRDHIGLTVTELTHPAPGKLDATLSVSSDRVDLHFEQQVWKSGVRLYSGETRGHCRGALVLKVEVVNKTEFPKGSIFPKVSVNVRVTDAKLYYEKLVVDHTAGLGGDAAKALGELLIQIVKAVKPHLEKDLLEKADAAIVKAATKKELTLTLDKLMASKPKPKDPAKP